MKDEWMTIMAKAAMERVKMEGWQPIETAPNEAGRIIIVWGKHYGPTLYQCYEKNTNKRAYIDGGFTHWMPLPEPPE